VDDGAYAAIVSGGWPKAIEVIVGEIIDAEPARLFGIRFGF
jgi:hypothetical protein